MSILIRPIEAKDAAGVAQLRRTPGVFENMLGIPSYRNTTSEEYISGLGSTSHVFVAVDTDSEPSEQVIGLSGLEVGHMDRVRHSGGMGIMVHPDYQGQGIGKQLMEAVLDMADNWLMLVRVELTVYADNHRAIHLYEKYGFEKEGLKRMAVIRSGQYIDELIMARFRTL